MEAEKELMRAGYIAKKVRSKIKSFVDVGVPVLNICEFVENMILELGGKPAFPCNVDINDVAAHYTSSFNINTVVPEGALVKVDLGVHIDGYIADTAITICFEPRFNGLIEAAEAGLDAAINTIKAGVRASEVGAAIENAIKIRGFAPIRNLTGHRMSRYLVHAGQSIPNISSFEKDYVLKAEEVYAIEPFSIQKKSIGLVYDGLPGNIYRFKKKRSMKNKIAKKMLKFIMLEYYNLPFASRWVLKKFPTPGNNEAFEELVTSKCIYSYPQLIEKSHGPVAQAEHTVIVTGDGCLVTTA